MTILVTGSEGNIGQYVIRALRKQYPQAKIIRVELSEEGPSFDSEKMLYSGDLQDKSFVKKIFDEHKIDYVIHMAARLYGVAGFNSDVYGLLQNDIGSLLNVLGNSKKVKRFVYFSSSMVYESSTKVPFTEDLTEEIMPPKSSYGITKFLGEQAVRFFNQQYGVDYTIWRPFNVVSPLEDHNKEGAHVFVDMYRKLFVEKTDELEVYGSGKQVRCFTWVEDVTEAIAKFLTDERASKETFNIGSFESRDMLELVDMLIKIGKEKDAFREEYNPKITTGQTFFGVDVQLRIPSLEKIKNTLGWEYTTNFEDCFKKFVDYKLQHAD